ncbi:MAG TPA: O-antigen ligase family protein [Propionibacteriaceae bacterium]|nr:O-antigen ligase family protein [Propionibacteriaceae bacterium]
MKVRSVLGVLLLAAVIGVVALGAGAEAARSPLIAFGAGAAVLLLGVSAWQPALIPLAAMPLFLVAYRVGGAGTDLSLSDAVLGVCTVLVLVFAPHPFSRELRTLLWLDALYQLATLFTVIANPHRANTVEWFHEWMLVSGALLVGWTVGRAGYARAATNLLLAGTSAIGVIALVQAASHYAHGDFSPLYVTWPYGMQKNAVGTLMSFAIVIAFANPPWLRLSRHVGRAVFWLAAAGMLVTQSRQAIVAAGVGLLVLSLRGGHSGRRRPEVAAFLVVPALAVVATLVRDQIVLGNQFSSANQRIVWYQESFDYFLKAPLVGHGLRFWYYDPVLAFQPPNAELEVAASAGFVGLVAFVVLMIGVLVVLWRLPPGVGTLAFTIVLTRFVQGQMDLYWVAVQVPLPYIVAGICLGLVPARRPGPLPALEERARAVEVAA